MSTINRTDIQQLSHSIALALSEESLLADSEGIRKAAQFIFMVLHEFMEKKDEQT